MGTFDDNDNLTGSKVNLNKFTSAYGALKLLEYLGYGQTTTKLYSETAGVNRSIYPISSAGSYLRYLDQQLVTATSLY